MRKKSNNLTVEVEEAINTVVFSIEWMDTYYPQSIQRGTSTPVMWDNAISDMINNAIQFWLNGDGYFKNRRIVRPGWSIKDILSVLNTMIGRELRRKLTDMTDEQLGQIDLTRDPICDRIRFLLIVKNKLRR